MTKIAGPGSESGSISQKHGSADPDPDPPQNVMDPEHCSIYGTVPVLTTVCAKPDSPYSQYKLKPIGCFFLQISANVMKGSVQVLHFNGFL
jgi:hypothetical protein